MFEAAKNGTRYFPCPVCTKPLDVRQTKKAKPYVVCNGCGVQLFVREAGGIKAFDRLVDGTAEKGVWNRLRELEQRYRLKCPECGTSFWVEPRMVKTSWVNGSLEGVACPEEGCEGVAVWKNQKAK